MSHEGSAAPGAVGPDLARLYDAAYGPGYDPAWRRTGAIDKAANIARLAAGYPHASILEIGAGAGEVLHRLGEMGFGSRLWAVEISPAAVELIRGAGIPRLEEVRLFEGARVPFPDRQFDLVILSHVLEHLEHPRAMLYEASRLGRFVLVEVPLEHHLRMPREFVMDVATGHINHYSRTSARYLLQTCRLRILADLLTCPSPDTYRHMAGARGVVKQRVKTAALRLLPDVAAQLFTFHYTMIAESPPLAP